MQNTMVRDHIDILSVDLLDSQRTIVEELKMLSAELKIGLGWHYLLDLSWILSHLNGIDHLQVMDAGAGTGLMQWYLAQKGARIISVDRSSRAYLPLIYRFFYRVEGMRPEDLASPVQVWQKNISQAPSLPARVKSLVKGGVGLLSLPFVSRRGGQVVIYNQDLMNLKDVPSDSLDAVVAVSALEHNSPENLSKVVAELTRVLKPGGMLLATLGAGKDQDWFHEPSQGWNYTASSLRRLFDLPEDTPDNYASHDELMETLRNCAELRDNLADMYRQSGNNGMPWGKWDPQYQPVGVCKVKHS